MSTSPPPNRRRKLRRRFSSVSPVPKEWTRPLASAPLPNAPNRDNRPMSLTLGRAFHRSRRSDEFVTEEEVENITESIHSAPSFRHLYQKDSNHSIPLLYSSLPPTPISASPSPRPFEPEPPPAPLRISSPPSFQSDLPKATPPETTPFSLWDYLREELLATDFDSHQELKWDRVSNFLSIPLAMEKVCIVFLLMHRSWSTCVIPDYRIRVHRLFRLVPLYIHNSPYTLPLGFFPPLSQFLSVLGSSPSTGSEGRHITGSSPHRLSPYSQSFDGRE